MRDLSTDDPHQFPTLSIDWDLYGSMLDESDLTDEQKRELIESLWAIVLTFVDLGFGIHPLQQACGEDQENLTQALTDLVSSSHTNDIIELNHAPNVNGANEGSL